MNSLHISAIILAKMATQDGKIADEERSYLQMVCARLDDVDVDELLEQARSETLSTLVERLERYADRFFIAMRAYMMANIDQHFDASEEGFFERLVELMEITDEDRELIRRAEAETRAVEPQPPHPRIVELFEASSFSAAASAG